VLSVQGLPLLHFLKGLFISQGLDDSFNALGSFFIGSGGVDPFVELMLPTF